LKATALLRRILDDVCADVSIGEMRQGIGAIAGFCGAI